MHTINKLTSDICWALNDDQVLAVCLIDSIDLKKAFDTVWTQRLIYKLHKKRLPQHLIHIILNMTSAPHPLFEYDRKFRVIKQGKISINTFSVKNSLQQDPINSPILFNLFFSDILILFKINEDQGFKTIAYADDLIIYCHHRKVSVVRDKLQDLLQIDIARIGE